MSVAQKRIIAKEAMRYDTLYWRVFNDRRSTYRTSSATSRQPKFGACWLHQENTIMYIWCSVLVCFPAFFSTIWRLSSRKDLPQSDLEHHRRIVCQCFCKVGTRWKHRHNRFSRKRVELFSNAESCGYLFELCTFRIFLSSYVYKGTPFSLEVEIFGWGFHPEY